MLDAEAARSVTASGRRNAFVAREVVGDLEGDSVEPTLDQRLADAFGGGFDPRAIADRQLGLLRQAAAPQEQQAQRSFIQDLYGSGRGAVTGAVGDEGSMGGGRLAAAFGQGLGRADLDRQVQAQEMGINSANASEGLLKSAFGRFMDSSQFAQDSNTNAFNRTRGMLTQGRGFAAEDAGLPAQIAQMFAQLGNTGTGAALDMGQYGLAGQNAALNVASAGANARIGSGQNVANFMGTRSSTPALSAVSNLFGGMATPQSGQAAFDMFANLFKRAPSGGTVMGDGGVP